VRKSLERIDVEVVTAPGLFAVDDPTTLRNSTGEPYRVFTPFHRAWLHAPRRRALAAPTSVPAPPGLDTERLPTLEELGLEQVCTNPAQGGERRGRQVIRRFLSEQVAGYGSRRDALASDSTSRLSPYLHFGCISPRELEQLLGEGNRHAAFRRQLCWRDFYAQVLAHFPENARSEFQSRYRGTIRWSRAKKRFEAWCEGATGYPLVDSAMRQLRLEGWMHNRARLVVGSFLTKDLGIDWRWGERWFMRLLIDGDEANNNGNWQWIASVGVDPQPAFRRIYNPARQQQRFDPHGEYVRRYVPELRDVPDEYLAEPWTMPDAVQKQAGCVIGSDYPRPIVDHAAARRDALNRYARAGATSPA
jgi:deoxyribodipyrimidine photo-lyase